MSYRLLGLDPYQPAHVAARAPRHSQAGGRTARPLPAQSPSTIPAWPTTRRNSRKLSDELFGDGTGVHHVGKGTVYAGQDLGDVFKAMNVGARLRLHASPKPTRAFYSPIASWPTAMSTLWTTATTAPRHVDATFRVSGKAPELWHADTGKIENRRRSRSPTGAPPFLSSWNPGARSSSSSASLSHQLRAPCPQLLRRCSRTWRAPGA